MSHFVARGVGILAAAGLVPVAAAPAEVCVACSEPSAWYRCAFSGEGVPLASTAALQLLCIKELAQRGGHQLCRVDRTRAGEPCSAPLVLVAPPAEGLITKPVAMPAPVGPPGQSPPATDNPTVKAPDEGAPKTMEELAVKSAEKSKKDWAEAQDKLAQTGEQTGQQLKKASSAVGEAVAKSWECVASLLKRC